LITYAKYLRIIKLNWLHLVGFYLVIEVMMITYAVVEVLRTHNWQVFIAQVFLNAFFLMFTYGLIQLVLFFVVLLLLDIILFASFNRSTLSIMLMEWLLICPLFIYWAFIYGYWLWIALAASFLFTQVWRSKKSARQ
jgi:hypothetical protein